MMDFIAPGALRALAEVLMIDVALAGDNAVVVGMAAASLPEGQRKRAILIGIAAATLMRVVLAAFTTQLLQVVGLVLAVAGAAREHAWILILGLAVSVALMGAASTLIARLLRRYHWIAYVGFAVILWVAVQMVWDGLYEVKEAVA